LHEDHHRYTKGRFEKNDVFSIFFSGISFVLILSGWLSGYDIKFFIGIGVMMYGIGYFLFHDILYHRRIKIRFRPKSTYYKRIVNAHTIHHQKSKAHEGLCFGFLYANKKYAVK
jgi:beta-carotene 3-hydroxylase